MADADGDDRRGRSPRVSITATTPSLFPTLRVRPLIGRLFRDGDGTRGQPGLVILSHGLWVDLDQNSTVAPNLNKRPPITSVGTP
jgi:hypothetical protein